MSKMEFRLFRKGHGSTTHIVIGLVVLGILYYFNKINKLIDVTTLTYLDYAFIIFITWAYSQAPDSDQPGSKINKYLTVFGIGVIIYAFYTEHKLIGIATAVILGLFRIIEHRTLIHSLGGAIIFALPLYFIKSIYAYVAFIMFLAHIISEGEFSIWSEKDWRIFKK